MKENKENKENKEEKQNFLCEEILNKGYDPEKFLEFIKEIKGENADLDFISMGELKNVKNFFSLIFFFLAY